MKTSKKISKRGFFLSGFVLLTTVFVVFTVFTNRSVIRIRLNELNQYLNSVNRENSGAEYLHMVAKFKLSRDLYNKKIDDVLFSMREMDISNLFFMQVNPQKPLLKTDVFVLGIINTFREITGKNKLDITGYDTKITALDRAYYYEVTSQYKKALDLYAAGFSGGGAANEVIELHRGYCYAVIGDNENAEKCFYNVINKYDNENASITAVLLLKMLKDIKKERDYVIKTETDRVELSEKLVNLVSYKEALEILDSSGIDSLRVRYLRARCFEESGERLEAVKLYQQIIDLDSESEYAILANRRILINGSSVKELRGLKDVAFNNNRLLKDSEFEKLMRRSKITGDDDYPTDGAAAEVTAVIDEMVAASKDKADDPEGEMSVLSDNDMIKNIIKDGEKENSSYTIEYKDPAGRVFKIEKYDGKGVLTGFYIYRYNKKGVRVKIDAYDKNGKILSYY